MTFLIRQIQVTADGREIVRSTTSEKPVISFGRSGDNDVAMADLAIDLRHATAEQTGPKSFRLTAVGSLGFEIDGRSAMQADIDAAIGAEIAFASYRVTVSSDEDKIVLTVRRVEATKDKDEAQVFTLADKMPGKRRLAWIFALVILATLLALPIISYAMRPAQDTRNIYKVIGDGAWSPGALSKAHHKLEENCESCHQQAFVSVRDSACQTCHKDVHDHAPAPLLKAARGSPGIGGAILNTVAAVFNKPPPGACVDCHLEHEGAGDMPPTPQAFCSDCHSDLKDQLPKTQLLNASDFGTDHPEFRPLIRPGTVAFNYPLPRFERVSLSKHPTDDQGLKFPHELHLSKTGAVARMAQSLKGDYDFGNALACKDCHKETPDGVRFQAVDMKSDCQMCHSLAFERIDGTVRTLRHGEPDQVVADLRAYYRTTGPAVPPTLGATPRRLPGLYAQSRVARTYQWAAVARPANAEEAIKAVFSQGGACYDCHVIGAPGTNGKPGWQVMPVHQPQRYMMKGWFDHKAHKEEPCATCHAAAKSTRATDLLLPGIAVCRDCHGGPSSKADVPSNCAMCHSYHADDGAPWKAEADRKRPRGKVVAAVGGPYPSFASAGAP